MKLMPRSDKSTATLMKKAAGGRRSLVDAYLKALGITDLTLATVPALIHKDYLPEWRAFLNAIPKRSENPSREAIRVTLSFLAYAHELKFGVVDERFTFRDPVSGETAIKPKTIRRAILEWEQELVMEIFRNTLRDTRLDRHLRMSTRKNKLVRIGTKRQVMSTFILRPLSSRVRLDAVLPLLSGSLYHGRLPYALQSVTKTVGKATKEVTPYADTMTLGPDTDGWHPIEANTEFSAYVRRARGDAIVLKLILASKVISVDFSDPSIEDHFTLWSKLKL